LSQRSGDAQPGDAALHRLRSDAIVYLQRGVAAARNTGRMTDVLATSALYLVQASLGSGDYAEAIRLLEERPLGPLSLVERADPAASRPAYAIEVYKAAMRAYVSVTPPQAQKAVDVMQRLEQAFAKSGGRADQLTRIYISLAMALDEQIQQLRDAGRDAEAARVSGAFAEFLDQIGARQQGGSWATRHWMAHTYYTMAANLRATSAGNTGQARDYLTKARDISRTLLADTGQDPHLAPSPTALLAVHKLLGDCYRELGEFKPALDMFSAVLKEQEAQLSVQQAAAQTYQAWGVAADPKWLERAIYGGYKLRSTGKNRIWGWLRLAQVAEQAARSNPAYRDAFFEARLEAARCRYLVGRKTAGNERKQHFDTALQSIRSLEQLYPDLGGPRWRGEFDRLLENIQRAQGD